MQGTGHRVHRVQGSGYKVQGTGYRVQGARYRVQGSGFGFRVEGTGFKVQGIRYTTKVSRNGSRPSGARTCPNSFDLVRFSRRSWRLAQDQISAKVYSARCSAGWVQGAQYRVQGTK